MANNTKKSSGKIKSLFAKENVQRLLKGLALVVVGVIVGGTVSLTVTTNPDGNAVVELKTEIVEDSSIEIADTQVEAVVINEDGVEVVSEDIVTVESVDGGEVTTAECSEGQECGRGAYADTSSPYAFYQSIINQCVDVDGAYGSQCYDAMALFWQNYAGRNLTTCGTGAAKGIWSCKEANAGSDFVLITDKTQLQAGDIVVTSTGTWGHTGMAMGSYNNGYISLLGTNQGGTACAGGGSTANVINLNLKDFLGAFRPTAYVAEPVAEESSDTDSCDTIKVEAGDTLGDIMLKCEGKVEYGEAMNEYAKQWVSTDYRLYDTVYDGWASEGGYGLFAGDTIQKK